MKETENVTSIPANIAYKGMQSDGFYLPIENETGFRFQKLFGTIPKLAMAGHTGNRNLNVSLNTITLYEELKSLNWKEVFSIYKIINSDLARTVLIFENEVSEHFLVELPITKNALIYQVDFLSDADDPTNFLKFLELFYKHCVVDNFTNCEINLILNKGSKLFTQSYEIDPPVLDVELNYGKDFVAKDSFLQEKLNKEKKGLILLHGLPGTGKTYYIKYLLSKISRKIIYLPSHMVNALADPSFLALMQENSDSVLVIEDGEKALIPRTVGFDGSVANILNLTDGFLSDVLKILVIITFNTSKKNIDEALLRKGRLIFEHEFQHLSAIDAMKLYKHLYNEEIVFKEPVSLAEIYNLEENYNSHSSKKKIGFKE